MTVPQHLGFKSRSSSYFYSTLKPKAVQKPRGRARGRRRTEGRSGTHL